MYDRVMHSPLGGPTSPASTTPSSHSHLRVAVAWVLILAIGVPLGLLVRRLWVEWAILMAEENAATANMVIGYRNIAPAISRAARPKPWRREEGSDLLIWSGWKNGEGHRWFRLVSGDCDPDSIGDPLGRDVAQSIDFPAVEVGGGPIWERIPEEADVVGMSIGMTPCVYPKVVLAKVLIVNDEVEGTPMLLHDDPFFAGSERGIAVFDPRLDGRRITMGSSGFTVDGHHVLYDRGTESLWIDRGDGMTAFSGKHKGRTLPLVRRLTVTSWGEWQAGNPSSRLLVGSLDRRRSLPAE